MEDLQDTFVFCIDSLDTDVRFQTEQLQLLDDDDIRLLTSLDDGLDSEID